MSYECGVNVPRSAKRKADDMSTLVCLGVPDFMLARLVDEKGELNIDVEISRRSGGED